MFMHRDQLLCSFSYPESSSDFLQQVLFPILSISKPASLKSICYFLFVFLIILGDFMVFAYRRRWGIHSIKGVRPIYGGKKMSLVEVDGSSVRAEVPGTKLEMTTELDTK